MRRRFGNKTLERLVKEDLAEFSETITERYRNRVNLIKNALDERDSYNLKSLHFEKLSGNRSHQYSMRLNKQWRLILEFEGAAPEKTVVIAAIEDYQ